MLIFVEKNNCINKFFRMKTNVTLKSTDRYLFDVKIKHRTQPDMLCLTDLQNVYNKKCKEFGWKERILADILNYKRSPETAERIYYILKERGFINTQFCEFIEQVEEQTLIKVLKDLKLYKTHGRSTGKLTFANPDIFVLLAMELNPMLYAKVVIWLSDKLIFNRIGVGDDGTQLMSRIKKMWKPDVSVYANIQRGLNYIVFGKHHAGIRNEATEKQLDEMRKLQNNYVYGIDTGFIETSDDLLCEMRKEFVKRWLDNDPKFLNKITKKKNKL